MLSRKYLTGTRNQFRVSLNVQHKDTSKAYTLLHHTQFRNSYQTILLQHASNKECQLQVITLLAILNQLCLLMLINSQESI